MDFLKVRSLIHLVWVLGVSFSCAVKQESLDSSETNIFRKHSDAELVKAMVNKVDLVGETERVGPFEDRKRDVKVIRGTYKVVVTDEVRKAMPWLNDLTEYKVENTGKPCYLYFDLNQWAVGDKSPSYSVMLKRGNDKEDFEVASPNNPGFDRKKSEGRTHIISWLRTGFIGESRNGYVSLDLDEESRLVSVTRGDRDPLPRTAR
jgi:hypothetical protein